MSFFVYFVFLTIQVCFFKFTFKLVNLGQVIENESLIAF